MHPRAALLLPLIAACAAAPAAPPAADPVARAAPPAAAPAAPAAPPAADAAAPATPPAADAAARQPHPQDGRFYCVPGKHQAPAARITDGEVQCYSDNSEYCTGRCPDHLAAIVPFQPPAGAQFEALACTGFGALYGKPGWCREVCQALPGCAHKDVPLDPPPPPPPPRVRKPRPPPPQEIAGEGPCETDADCSVDNGRSCCGCRTFEVRSRLHQVEPPPACGCGDMSRSQLLPRRPDGDDDEPSGPCGGLPPEAGSYRATCRAKACVAVRR